MTNHYCPVEHFQKRRNRMITRKKLAKMSFYDLKYFPGVWGLAPLRMFLEETYREPRTNRIRPDHAVSFSRRVPSMRRALRWESQRQELLLLGSVSCHGFCAAHLSRESSRHRSLSGCTAQQALPLRSERASEAFFSGRCQRTSGLENLRRF